MITVENLCKNIEGTPILRSLNMHVPKCSVYGLVGPNGAGKSTLLRTIAGSYKYESGSLTLEGQNIYESPLVKERIAYVPDDIFYQTADSINSLAKLFKGLYKTFNMERFEKLLNAFPALDKKKLLRSYSKGMQRQAGVLLALCISPDVMLLDEPLDGLDPVMRRQVLSLLMDDVAKRKTTIIISSHNLRELEDICDHVGIMEDGKIVIERSLSDLQASVTKVQVAFEGDLPVFPENIEILHKISAGKVHTLIIKSEPGSAENILRSYNPVLIDILPLTLEEIFIYEMGGAGHDSKNSDSF